MLRYVSVFVAALVLSVVVTPVIRWIAIRLKVVDVPGERRIHSRPIPRLGGIAVYASLVSALCGVWAFEQYVLGSSPGYAGELPALFVGATAVMLLGAVDDCRPLTPRVKFTVQVLAAMVVVVTGNQIHSILGFDVGPLAIPITVLWVVGVTNALNLIDGLDGLAAGTGVIVSLTLAALLLTSGRIDEALILVALGGSLLGFLRYNFHPASIFLGDSGSLLLGFLLASLSIQASRKLSTAVAISVPILALGLPIMDTALAVVRRLLGCLNVVRKDEEKQRYEFLFAGRTAVFSADRQHIHHRLLDLGMSHRNAVLTLYGITCLFCAGAVVLVMQREPNQALLLAAFAIAAYFGVRRLDYSQIRVLKRGTLLPVFDLPLVNWRLLHVLGDLGFVVAANLAAHLVWSGFVWVPQARAGFLATVSLLSFVQIAAFAAGGIYRRSFRYSAIADVLALIRALAFALAATLVVRHFMAGAARPPLGWVILDAYLLSTAVIASRLSFCVLDHLFKKERPAQRRVLIYGAGNGGVVAINEIHDNPALDMKPIAFLDDDPAKRMRFLQGYPIHAAQDLERFIVRREFDELVIATAKISPKRLRAITERCAFAGLPVRRFSMAWDELPAERDRSAAGATGGLRQSAVAS